MPIGNLTSQHFANFMLSPVDHLIKRQLRAPGYCRYMDDLLVFGDDKPTLWRWAAELERFLLGRLHLALRSEVTSVRSVSDGVPFLGFRIWPHHTRLDPSRLRRFRRRIRALQRHLDSGQLTEDAAERSAESLIGWVGHANTWRLRRAFFGRLNERSRA